MLVVVFGAGASYDSVSPSHNNYVGREEWRPPLAADLFTARPDSFGRIMMKFPDATALIMRLETAVENGTAVETEIQAITDEVGKTDYGKRQLAALRFYLQEVTWAAGENWAAAAFGRTNYVAITNAIEVWRQRNDEEVTYVTFNYDLMLEEALRPIVTFEDFHGYVDGPTRLIKVHGSADWGRATEFTGLSGSGDYRWPLIREAAEREEAATGWFRFGSYGMSQPAGRGPGGTFLYPALALPTTGKAGFVCPDGHVEALRAALAKMDRLIVIGWKGQETHFLNLLNGVNQGVAGHVVTSKRVSAQTLAAALGRRMTGLKTATIDAGFSGYVRGGDIQALFAEQPGAEA